MTTPAELRADEPLRVGEMYIEILPRKKGKSPRFELVQAVEVTDDIREILREAGYDVSDLY